MIARHAVTGEPVEINRLLHTNIVVKRYTKPERTPGGLYIADSYRDDSTQTLWELVMSNEAAEEHLGYALDPDDIIVTLRRWPVDLGLETEDGEPLFIMRAEEVRNTIKWKEEEHGTEST